MTSGDAALILSMSGKKPKLVCTVNGKGVPTPKDLTVHGGL